METERLKAGELPKSLGEFLGVGNPYCTPRTTAQALRYWAAQEYPQQEAQGGRTYFSSEDLDGETLAE